ncbi:esterase [Siccibacter turicensis]|uniref:Esterase ypfH n=1 Tax=Siccibacter turicensis TaxID=357233 RepID=C7C542_9ENTR|nr:esterase [Siccibacter turicensis]CAZ90510.1 Esterase ypfH [Siccibacter turicensis LMG 23730]
MKHDHVVVHSPDVPPKQLLLLFHGVGDNPVSMGEIGRWFAPHFPDALVVSIGGPFPSGNEPGREWFSVQGVTDDNRPARVAEVMPRFVETVRYWQQQSGLNAAATALIGFSQGAIMALDSIHTTPRLASRIIAFNGRFATLPAQIASTVTIHLIHGGEDRVIELAHAAAAAEALEQAGGDVTLDVIEELGHAIDERSMKCAIEHLSFTVPKHYFDEALSGGTPKDDDIIELL